jgi:ceramide glucosyltransferase
MLISLTLATAIWALAIFLTLFSAYLTYRHFSDAAPHLDAPFALFPISIIKPLKGRDSGLRENLESFFQLDYPEYELRFCVADERDPAITVVKELMRDYPRVKAFLSFDAVDVGYNPKINNMYRAYERASYDWILVSDSNVRVAPDYLKKMIAHVDTSVGMVTSVVAGTNPGGVGANLEAMYLNTFYAKGMILTSRLGHPCVIGKSMLFQRSTAARFGGLKTLSCYLAEDYMAGQAVNRLGLRTVIAHEPVPQYIGSYSIREFWSRHIRWGRIRKAQAPVTFLIEPLLGCMISGIIGAWAAFHLMGIQPSHFILAHLLLWTACDTLVMRKMKIRISAATPLAWFLRESLAFPLWFHIALGNTVNWRGRCFAVKQGGLLEPVSESLDRDLSGSNDIKVYG